MWSTGRYIGLGVSLLCYSVVVVTFTWFRALQTTAKRILVRICLNLMIGETAFVVGVVLSSEADGLSAGACKAVGVVTHFFLLAAFSWMLANGFYIHTSFTSVFQSFVRDEKVMFRKYALLAYGVPLLIVVVTAVTTIDSYDNHADGGHCFLSADNGAIWAFVGPLLVVLTANIYMFVKVINEVARASVRRDSSLSEDDQKRWVFGIRVRMGAAVGCARCDAHAPVLHTWGVAGSKRGTAQNGRSMLASRSSSCWDSAGCLASSRWAT